MGHKTSLPSLQKHLDLAAVLSFSFVQLEWKEAGDMYGTAVAADGYGTAPYPVDHAPLVTDFLHICPSPRITMSSQLCSYNKAGANSLSWLAWADFESLAWR